MKIQITVCNVCASPDRPTSTYEVRKTTGRRKVLDLCIEHAAPIDELLGAQQPPAIPRDPTRTADAAPRATRRGGTPITTLADIERAKAGK